MSTPTKISYSIRWRRHDREPGLGEWCVIQGWNVELRGETEEDVRYVALKEAERLRDTYPGHDIEVLRTSVETVLEFKA